MEIYYVTDEKFCESYKLNCKFNIMPMPIIASHFTKYKFI